MIPFGAMVQVSFFWTAYVSFTRGSVSDNEEEEKMKVENVKRRLSTSGDL